MKNFIFRILQRKILQPFYEKAFLVFLRAMNYGGGSNPESSGEVVALGFALNKVEGNPVIFDVGANYGDFSQLVLNLCKKKQQACKIFAFEPVSRTFEILQKNLKNQASVHLNKKALGQSSGRQEIFTVKGEAGLSSLYERNLSFVKKVSELEEIVEVETLDNFCEQNQLNYIDYLKMDVEGHEFSVLAGAKKMLEQKKIRFIQFEFGGANIDSRTYFKDFYYLLSPNYKIFRILRGSLYPILNYKEIYEVFLTSNYLAVLK